MSAEESSTGIPTSWILLYVLLTLGVAAGAVLFVGGSIP